MSERVQRHRHRRDPEEVIHDSTEHAKSAEQLKKELDAVIDEIDETLNENEAHDFVNNFVQKGGQ